MGNIPLSVHMWPKGRNVTWDWPISPFCPSPHALAGWFRDGNGPKAADERSLRILARAVGRRCSLPAGVLSQGLSCPQNRGKES